MQAYSDYRRYFIQAHNFALVISWLNIPLLLKVKAQTLAIVETRKKVVDAWYSFHLQLSAVNQSILGELICFSNGTEWAFAGVRKLIEQLWFIIVYGYLNANVYISCQLIH